MGVEEHADLLRCLADDDDPSCRPHHRDRTVTTERPPVHHLEICPRRRGASIGFAPCPGGRGRTSRTATATRAPAPVRGPSVRIRERASPGLAVLVRHDLGDADPVLIADVHDLPRAITTSRLSTMSTGAPTARSNSMTSPGRSLARSPKVRLVLPIHTDTSTVTLRNWASRTAVLRPRSIASSRAAGGVAVGAGGCTDPWNWESPDGSPSGVAVSARVMEIPPL